jgi:hypothetical protein
MITNGGGLLGKEFVNKQAYQEFDDSSDVKTNTK